VRLETALRTHLVALVSMVLVIAAGVGIGIGSFLLQIYFHNQYLEGKFLSGWQNFLRQGAPWQALVPVAVAGLLALVGRARLESSQPEPGIGLSRLQAAPVSQLRAALRRERQVVTTTLTVLSALVAIVWTRLIVYLALAASGNALARATLTGVALEAVVWGLCWSCFWLWRRGYLAKLESWGVTAGG
jgi:hypothetical protein